MLILICINQVSFAQEYDKYELSKINFVGNNYFSSSTLSDVIFLKESPAWLWKFLNSISSSIGKEPIYFDSLIIRDDLRALSDYYNNNGFFKSKVSYFYEIDTSKKEVTLTYQIQEGYFSTYRKIDLLGLNNLPSEYKSEIKNMLSIDSTKRFQQSVVKENINSIINFLQNNGYMLGKFDSTLVYRDTINYKADLEIYFNANNKYAISSIFVEKSGEGSPSVESDLLVDIVGIKKGDLYSLEKHRQSQVRLFRTGLFNSISVLPSIQDTSGNWVPLKISGNIGAMNELAPEIIMNNQQNTFNLGLGLSYARKNFLGDARKLTLNGSFGLEDFFQVNFGRLFKNFSINDTSLIGYVETRLRIEQPYFLNKPIFGILEGYFNITKENLLRSRVYGAKLSFEFEMPTYTFISFLTTYYNLEVVDVNVDLSRTGLAAYFKNFQLNSTLSVIGADIRSSKVDNPLFPSTGHNLSVIIEEANFFPFLVSKIFNYKYNRTSFYKSLFTFSWYALSNKRKTSVFALKFKTGYIQAYSGSNSNIPETRKFFSGGSNSIRGWRARELRPETFSYFVTIPVVNLGGNFLLEGSLEFRRKFSESMGFALFLDYGNTFSGYKEFRFDMLTVAAGTGIRYYTDFAPFRIDFGFKTYDPYVKKNMFKRRLIDIMEFHFGIGEAF